MVCPGDSSTNTSQRPDSTTNMVSPGSPWWTMTEPLVAEAGASRRARACRMLSGSVKKMATRSRIWNRFLSSSELPPLSCWASLKTGEL